MVDAEPCLHCEKKNREMLATCNHSSPIHRLFSITQQVRVYHITASAAFRPDWHAGMG